MTDLSVLKIFEKRGFKTNYFQNKQELNDFLKSEIVDNTVGMGGSMSLAQLDVYDAIKDNNKVYWHQLERSKEVFENAMLAEVYITSANAVSQTGEIINIDGNGNRVSASIYGVNRKKVLFICGTNKLEPDLHKALWRAKNISAPKNAMRLNRKTPCAIKGDKCYNCNSPDRICNVTSIITHPTSAQYHIIFVEGEYGL